MRAAADVQAVGERIARSLQFARLVHKQVGGYDAAVADDVHLVLGEYAGGNGAQHKLLAVEDDRVPRIASACEARYDVIPRGEEIYYLPLAFVSENYTQKGVNFSLYHCL